MLFWLTLAPIFIAIFIYLFPAKKAGRIITIAAHTALVCCSFYIFLLCKQGDIVSRVGNFEGSLGMTLKADTFSSVFILLTSFIFLVAALYNFSEQLSSLFWFLGFIWQGMLIGIFLTQDLFNIFVLAEVATVVVSILIMYHRSKRSMLDGMIYMMANTVAIQFYLFGVGYIYKLTGTLDIGAATIALQTIDKASLVLPYALIITSISLKCALMPLFSWLPKAHGSPGAPSSVSAILSGLHIKSGIFLFIRVQGLFQEINISTFFLVAGIITGIAGFVLALSQSDIKLVLAYSTVSQIGMIMIGLNMDDIYSYIGGVYHIINHALFKSVLFLSAGIISQVYGTRKLKEIKGVFKRMPFIGTIIVMAILGITGAPFFNGSISKYFIGSGAAGFVNIAVIFINLGTIITFIKFSSILVEGKKGEKKVADLEIIRIDWSKRAAILILGILCLAGGIFGEQAISFLFQISISVDTVGYLQKVGLFLLSGTVGYFIYQYYVSKSTFLKRIRELELSFRGICVSIGVFFAAILIVVGVFGV